MVDFLHERRLEGLVAGLDEVGRGPLAGPVVAAAVIVANKRVPPRLRGLVDDSKRLTPARRAQAFASLRACAADGELWFALGAAATREIDAINILQASFLAMRRALARLAKRPDAILVDGNRLPPGIGLPGEAIVGGDARCFSIAAASIIAKEVRDQAMRRLAARHPGFGWESNMGYGTRSHLQGIESRGATRHHRLSFAPLATARDGV
ncbi:MAG: ribonuclease HII [Alphaproteobacteria bacterium]|nr:ribonuclease HII [Alphaproteobacteria bacterium]